MALISSCYQIRISQALNQTQDISISTDNVQYKMTISPLIDVSVPVS